ncbi:MAG: hypothetical protein NXI32_15170 [bacterium]|nr:hypothetical protein [bacterium]
MQWKQAANWLLSQVEPELPPVYLLTNGEAKSVDSRLGFSQHAGWTSPIADLLFSQFLNNLDAWQGRGFCAVVDVNQHDSLQSLLGCVLHEFAHWTTFGEVQSDDSIDLPLGRVALKVAPKQWAKPQPATELPGWTGHGADWVRACCHLSHRASGVVASLRPKHLQFGQQYFGSPFTEDAFMASLACELHDRRPIRQILTDDEPEAFRRLWGLATAD